MSNSLLPALSIIAITNIILAVFIFSRGIKQLTNVLFGLIAFTCALWSLSIIGFYSDEFRMQVNWLALTHLSAISIAFFFLLFSLNFPQRLFKNRSIFYSITLLILATAYSLFFTRYIVGVPTGFNYEIGMGYVLYTLFLVGSFFAGYFFLVKQYKKGTSRNQKSQVGYVLAGSLIASTLAIIPDLILPFFHVFSYTWLGPIFTLLMVISIFLAILRYHLFDIKLILTELVSITIIVALIIEIFFVTSVEELILKTIILVIVACFSYILIKSVYNEIAQREKIEALASDLEKVNIRLTELDRQKSEFVSFATHQLRAPLTAMKGYGSLLLEGDMGKLTLQAKEGIQRIYDSTNTLVSIVDDYLNISRIELGTMKYAFETIDLKSLIEDTIAELKPNIEKSGLAFSFTPENNGTDYRTTADRDKLKQVIANVIDNSMKYTPSGSVAVSLSLDRVRHKFIFQVKDTGVGIAPETLPHLFQKFSRAENANKVNIRGTGLGLFVAKQMVEAHHGTIRAESPGEGRGSTFIVELEPFAKA